MVQRTVTRKDLADAVQQRIGFSRSDSTRLVENILETVIQALEDGETVKIRAFGSIHPRTQGPRTGRNPKTGVLVPIAERTTVVFRPAEALRKAVNGSQS